MNAPPTDLRQMTALGRAIEDESFTIVDREAWPHDFDRAQWEVVRRVIHATADFEYKHLVRFSSDALASGVTALGRGAPVITDVKMIITGLNAARLASFGASAHTFIDDEAVIARARQDATTRAVTSMREAARRGLLAGGIVAIGNAPTALLEVVRLAREEGIVPALVLGMPVGFVNAAESKEELLRSGIPHIVTRGRKGGSTVTVAALHAVMHVATGDLR